MNKCKHPSALGVTQIYDEDVGICCDCYTVHYRRSGKKVERDVALIWIERHPQEAINFHVKEMYKKKMI